MVNIAADFNPLDTRSRQKVIDAIRQLSDFGLSEDDILGSYGKAQGLGRAGLRDYFDTAGLAIGRQMEPTFQAGTNFLGSNPLLADSGYSNRLQRQIMTDLAGRLSSDFGQEASRVASGNLDWLKNLYGQRFQNRANLAQSAYGTFTGLPKKPTVGSQIGQGVTSLAGAAIGGYLSRPPKPKTAAV